MKKFLEKIKKNKRLLIDILVWFVIIIGFIIIASFLVFKASGFAYNFKTGKVEKTGLLYISTYPKSTDVFLDKEYKGNNTPLRISYLLPGKYNLEIKKDGYKSINKTIIIYEGLATKVNDALLILESLEFKEIDSPNIIDFKTIDKNNTFILYDKKGIHISTLDLKENKLKNIHLLSDLSANSRIIESINNDYLLIKSDENYFVLNWKTGNNYNLNNKIPIKEIDNLDVYKNTLIIQSKKLLISYNIIDQKITEIAQDIVDFYVNSYIYALRSFENKNQIVRISTSSFKVNIIEADLDIALPIKIQVSKDKQYAILDDDNNLHVYFNKNLALLNKQVQGFHWTTDRNWLEFGEKLALTYYTNNELWVYQKNNKDIFNQARENYLLRRLSDKISESNFFYNQYYVYFVSNDELSISDLKGHATKIFDLNPTIKYDFFDNYSKLLILKNGILKFSSIR